MKKSLAQNSFYNMIYQTLSFIFPLITSIYVSRIIFEDGIGKVAYAQNITSYFTTFASLGIPIYGIREISKVRNKKEEKNKIFSELIIINSVSTLFSIVLYFIFLILFINKKDDFFLYLATGLVLFFNFFNIDWFYQGEEEYGYITIRSFIIKIVLLLFLFLFVHAKRDYILYALITSLGVVFNYTFNAFHSKKMVKIVFFKLKIKKHIKPIIFLAITIFLGTIYSKLDITMLGLMSTESNIGYYSNANKIILMLLTGCQAVSASFLPRLSYLFHKNKSAFDNLINTGLEIILFIVVPATTGLLILAKKIVIVLYGEAFLPASVCLQIFAPLLIIRPVGDLLCYQLLISMNMEKKRIPAYVIATIANFLMNFFLIPYMKEDGAALASLISELLVNGIQLRIVTKLIKISIRKKYVFKVFFSSVLMGLIVSLATIFSGDSAISILFTTLLGILIYILINIILKNEIIQIGLSRVNSFLQEYKVNKE